MMHCIVLSLSFIFTSAFHPCDSLSSSACREPIYGDRYATKTSPINTLVNWWWKTIDGDDILLELFHDQRGVNSLHESYIDEEVYDDNTIIETVHYGSDLRPLGMVEQMVVGIVLIFWCICACYCFGMGFRYGWEMQEEQSRKDVLPIV